MLRNFTGSTGVRAVIAVLMLLFVVACAGSDSGIKRQRDEARAAAEAAEEARKAAEEQARKDAEAAAAAAEQARKDAEAAAAAAAEQARKDAEAAAAAAAQAAYDQAMVAIAAAETPEAAQAAYDEVKDQVTATQGDMLQAAVDARATALTAMARAAEQRRALMSAAGMIDTSDLSTQALVDAAKAGIVALRQAIDNAVDVDDTSMYQTMLDDAVAKVDGAQGGINTKTRRTNQMTALSSASGTLQAALTALSGSTPTQAQLDAANNALTALKTAIADGADLTDDEKAPYQREADNAAAPISTAQMAFDDAGDEADEAANAAMAATALKLYKGLEHGLGDNDNVRTGASDDAGVISVTIGTATAVPLAEDKKTTVAANDGWEGKRHTAEPTGDAGTYEAMVYSNVGDATEGDPFNEEYTLDGTTGELAIDTSDAAVAGRVASSNFDQSAGGKLFKLPANTVRVMLSGSYHGVSGTYYCTPTSTTTTCTSTIAASGFTLTGGTWTFKPGTATAKVMSVDDTTYASYGWWLHKSEDGKTYTASAFATARGTVPAASGITALRGTATYMGGAAGKYALSSSTGGTNDAGHFTARATLEADFDADMVTGTIDNFVDGDGASKNWSVELKKSTIGDAGPISSDGTDTAAGNETVWTIDGTAAASDGQWSGTLYDNDDGGVPKVGTGTFHSTYGQDGRMVGAFGVKKQ